MPSIDDTKANPGTCPCCGCSDPGHIESEGYGDDDVREITRTCSPCGCRWVETYDARPQSVEICDGGNRIQMAADVVGDAYHAEAPGCHHLASDNWLPDTLALLRDVDAEDNEIEAVRWAYEQHRDALSKLLKDS
jgi:hypothetical protein